MIKKILLENFKAYKYAEIEIKPITILVGPNNGGKTSLMQSIGLIKQTLSGGDGQILKFSGSLLHNLGDFDTLIHQASKEKEMHFRFDFENDKYFDMKIGKKDDGELYVKDFSCNNGEFEYIIEEIMPVEIKDDSKDSMYYKGSKYYSSKKPRINFKVDTEYEPLFNNLINNLRLIFKRENFFFKIAVLNPSKVSNFFYNENLLNEIYKYIQSNRNLKIFGSETDRYFYDVISVILSIQDISDNFFLNVKQDFENIKYIGPIRAMAERFYEMGVYDDVGFWGEHSTNILANDPNVKKDAENNFKSMDISESISIDIKKKNFEFKLKTKNTDKEINLVDMGCGTAQILPIIVQSIIPKKESLILIEQPEVHLHPKVQADLANFFLKVASKSRKFLLETHSDYFIENIRYGIMNGTIEPENVAIYYIRQDETEKSSTITEIRINSKGQYLTSDLPNGNLPQDYITNFRLKETRKMNKKLLENLRK